MPNLIVSKGVLELLRNRRVFLQFRGPERWRVGDYIGVNDNCVLEPYAQIFAGYMLPRVFGAFSYSHSTLNRALRVGRYCSIGSEVAWMGPEHPTTWASTSPTFYDVELPATRSFRATHETDYPVGAFPQKDVTVTIGHDVWIGDQAMIAPGVTIGAGAIVGARTLLLEDVPPYAIVVGHPGRILRYRVPETLIERFMTLEWWRYTPDVLSTLPANDPQRFLDSLEEKILRETPRPIAPVVLTAKDIIAAARGDGAQET